ncbi:hypothetical protein TKK_0018259 [Trichogramma kaykai]
MDTVSLEINIENILAILGDSKRPIIEGEAVLLAEHILLCGFKFSDDKNINLLAYVVQSSKIHGEPHEVNIELSITKDGKIILYIRQKWGREKRNIQHPYNNSALLTQNYCHFSREDAIVDYSSVD